jgi:hypothetical protein
MTEKKTLSERYVDEILTNNVALNHFSQCKDCIFRDKTNVNGVECGYNKCVCRIYGKLTASRSRYSSGELFFPYTPVEIADKPNYIFDNTGKCEYYEREKQK